MRYEGENYHFKYLSKEKPLDFLTEIHKINSIDNFRKDKLFVLLLGPSSVGKTTIIRTLNEQSDNQFLYIRPYTTRTLRLGETDKNSVSDKVFDELEKKNKFIYINNLYGVRYGTPLEDIQTALSSKRIPILDFPLNKVSALKRTEYDLVNIYIFPPTIKSWEEKIKDIGRDKDGRLESGLSEIETLSNMYKPHPDIHFSIVNKENRINNSSNKILSFIETIKNK